MGEKRGKSVIAARIEHTVSTTLRHARDIRYDDRQKVENVRDWRAMEVTVRLDSTIERYHGVVDRRSQFTVGPGLEMER